MLAQIHLCWNIGGTGSSLHPFDHRLPGVSACDFRSFNGRTSSLVSSIQTFSIAEITDFREINRLSTSCTPAFPIGVPETILSAHRITTSSSTEAFLHLYAQSVPYRPRHVIMLLRYSASHSDLCDSSFSTPL